MKYPETTHAMTELDEFPGNKLHTIFAVIKERIVCMMCVRLKPLDMLDLTCTHTISLLLASLSLPLKTVVEALYMPADVINCFTAMTSLENDQEKHTNFNL